MPPVVRPELGKIANGAVVVGSIALQVKKAPAEDESSFRKSPEDESSFFSKLFFQWASPIFALAADKAAAGDALEADDLWPLAHVASVAYCTL